MCAQTLAGGPLVCVRPDPHLTGHCYESTSGIAGTQRDDS